MGSSDNSLTISRALDIPSSLQKVLFSWVSCLNQSPKISPWPSHFTGLPCGMHRVNNTDLRGDGAASLQHSILPAPRTPEQWHEQNIHTRDLANYLTKSIYEFMCPLLLSFFSSLMSCHQTSHSGTGAGPRGEQRPRCSIHSLNAVFSKLENGNSPLQKRNQRVGARGLAFCVVSFRDEIWTDCKHQRAGLPGGN